MRWIVAIALFSGARLGKICQLRTTDLRQEGIQALIGHERGFTLDTYSGGFGLARLRGIVEKIEYPALDLTHLHVE